MLLCAVARIASIIVAEHNFQVKQQSVSRWLQSRLHASSSLADFFTLKMELIRSSETLVYTISTRRHIPEDGILHSHRRENLKSYEINCSSPHHSCLLNTEQQRNLCDRRSQFRPHSARTDIFLKILPMPLYLTRSSS
jgi:hypothetical protein